MALSVEVSEIVELFQWLAPEESRTLDEQAVSRLREEIGDVMVYLVGVADKFSIDPISAARDKLLLSAQKYPASVVRGKAKKYTEY